MVVWVAVTCGNVGVVCNDGGGDSGEICSGNSNRSSISVVVVMVA